MKDIFRLKSVSTKAFKKWLPSNWNRKSLIPLSSMKLSQSCWFLTVVFKMIIYYYDINNVKYLLKIFCRKKEEREEK